MTFALDLLLAGVGAPITSAAGYLLFATLFSVEREAPEAGTPDRKFRIIVPAHNEEEGIASTVESLLNIDYPAELREVVVVADNCDDHTAERARAAGAEVLERNDAQRRGKGYALLHAFERTPESVDAVVVIDADTLVSRNLLSAFAARRRLGAHAVQADYAVRNPDASWRTRLIAIAFGSFHIVRSRARETLGLSCGLRGNGMCFSREVLQKVPHDAFSVVEDVEYGLRLGEAGYRVHYADEAHVYGEMVSSAKAASSQRRRWEEGRRELVKKHAFRLLAAGLKRRDKVLLDLAFDLLVPPVSRIAVLSAAGFGAAVVGSVWFARPFISLVPYGFAVSAVGSYVLRGWMVSGTGARGLVDLAFSPVYVVWKASLRFRRPERATSSWVRTAREQPPTV